MSAETNIRPAHSRLNITIITLIVYVIADWSRPLLFSIDAYADTIRSLPEVMQWLENPIRGTIICMIALALTYRIGIRKIVTELGLTKPILPAFVFALVATCPMWIPPLLLPQFSVNIDPLDQLFTAGIWPLAEEILFRGYVFYQLHRRAGWSFLTSAILSSAVFGLAHLGAAAVQQQSLSGQFGSVAMITILSILGAWIYTRWDDNLWVMVALHGLMNLWWSVFHLGDNALGSVAGNIMRLSAVPLGIGITIYRKPIADFIRSQRVRFIDKRSDN